MRLYLNTLSKWMGHELLTLSMAVMPKSSSEGRLDESRAIPKYRWGRICVGGRVGSCGLRKRSSLRQGAVLGEPVRDRVGGFTLG